MGSNRFRHSPSHAAGTSASKVLQCRVMGTNYVNWTVDLISTFDRKYYLDVQIAAPYLHYNNGEGIYVCPEVGALCMACIPGDSTPPFVMGFIAPLEVAGTNPQAQGGAADSAVSIDSKGKSFIDTDVLDGQDAPAGTRSRGAASPYPLTDASFGAGRPQGKPGDIMARTRDGNFLILHRGGVVQIGATEIAQRIFIPISNKVLDVSGVYEHMNTGGGVSWGIQEGPSVDNPASQHIETFRLYANDKFCDLRIAKSKVFHPIGEPDGDAGSAEDLDALDIGKSEVIVYEITLAKGGFKQGTGDPSSSDVYNQTKMRFFFDRGGGGFARFEGNVMLRFKKNLKIVVDEDMEIHAKSLTIITKEGMAIGGGPLTEVKGDFVKIGAGSNPIARMGDPVAINIPVAQVTGTVGGNPFTGVLTMATPIFGAIVGGNPNLVG